MSEDNPYRSPETHGAVLHPSRWLQRGWADAPAAFAAMIGICLVPVAIASGVAAAIESTPGFRWSSGLLVGAIFLLWSLLWFASAENWWKGNIASSLVWMGLGLAPIAVLLVIVLI